MGSGNWNGRTMVIAACVIGAGLLSAAALIGEPSKKGPAWEPLNAAVAQVLEEKETSEDRAQEAGSSLENADKSIAAGTGKAGNGTGVDSSGSETAGEAANGINDGQREGNLVHNVERSIDSEEQAQGGSQSGSAVDARGRLDINRATADQLDGLKGIGPSKAQAIVDDREKNGPFRSVDDLLRVKGIGQKLLASVKESVVALP